MRLVERGGVDHGINPEQAAPNEITIGDRADMRSRGRLEKVEPHNLMLTLSQRPDQTFTQVAGASSHEHPHRVWTPLLLRAHVSDVKTTVRQALRIVVSLKASTAKCLHELILGEETEFMYFARVPSSFRRRNLVVEVQTREPCLQLYATRTCDANILGIADIADHPLGIEYAGF